MSEIVMYGTDWCADCHRSRRFLDSRRVPYRYVDLEERPDLLDEVVSRNDGMHVVPTIVFPDGDHLSEPSDTELARRLGLDI